MEKAAILSPDFFQIDALDLAPCLLGKFLRRDDVVLRITEAQSDIQKWFMKQHDKGNGNASKPGKPTMDKPSPPTS